MCLLLYINVSKFLYNINAAKVPFTLNEAYLDNSHSFYEFSLEDISTITTPKGVWLPPWLSYEKSEELISIVKNKNKRRLFENKNKKEVKIITLLDRILLMKECRASFQA